VGGSEQCSTVAEQTASISPEGNLDFPSEAKATLRLYFTFNLDREMDLRRVHKSEEELIYFLGLSPSGPSQHS